ncbi:MAG: Nif11 family protein [Cyanobacteriota bacterium]|nr:Nif11 family protein [Cyanobacteriota bacterium]
MSWSELERLVDDAESDPALRRGLRRCRSRREFLLASARLGYRIQPRDLRMAWSLDQGQGGASGRAASR